MKSFIFIVAFLGMNIATFSQEKTIKSTEKETMKAIELPEIVIKTAGKDFSYYLPDKDNPSFSVNQLEKEFIGYELGKDEEGYESYLVIFSNDKGTLSATYDEKGKLTSVVEKYNNIILPSPVIYSMYRAYPDWKIVNDKYLYTQEKGDVTKKHYNLKLTKGKETMKLKVNPQGEIISKS